MDKFPNWTNQYISLVKAKPEYIASCAREEDSTEKAALLQAKAEQFRQTYCELGCGSGEHLIGQALVNPQSLHIGIELRFKRTYRAAEKAEAAQLSNIFFLQTDAMRITEFFKPGSLQGVFVNFPDPWEKRRWRKHRMLSAEFLEKIFGLLKTGGFLSYKTDHAEYFRETLALLQSKEGVILTKITENLAISEFATGNIPSEFEGLFRSKGLPVYFLEAKKNW